VHPHGCTLRHLGPASICGYALFGPERCTIGLSTYGSVVDFLNGIAQEQRRKDCFVLLEMMQEASNEQPVLWSNGHIGFGLKRHTGATTGRESDWMRIGFSPRKANFPVNFGNYINEHAAALENPGKFKTGLGCLYINKPADVDLAVVKGMVVEGVSRYP
jgi:hypothetical protein